MARQYNQAIVLLKHAASEYTTDILQPDMADVSAALAVLQDLYPLYAKEASVIHELKQVKFESDRSNWRAKHMKLRALMRQYPNDFYINSTDKHLAGVTHKSGFRFHMPADEVPEGYLARPIGVAPWQNQYEKQQ